jgi:NADPH-dependent 2,4-dienoyl-CoA reductase/sulfur reductase-like enzyme
VNPAAGRNPLFDNIGRAEPTGKIVVVGGGAAGMEAARRASERGHSVVLLEKEPRLGGSLLAAGANSLKDDVRRYAKWSVDTTMKAPNVDVRLGCSATRAGIEELRPDAVILATGSEQIVPDIPGVNGDNVCFATDIDLGLRTAGKRVVIIGAGLTGTETAVALARDGHEATLMDALELREIDARGGTSMSVTAVLRGMAMREGVKTLTGLRAVSITREGVVVEDADGVQSTLECDTVALSVGVRPVKLAEDELRGLGVPVISAGDCAGRPGNIASAVLSGFNSAINIRL